MPISSDRGSVNTAPIAGIGEGNLTPAVGDFMAAFRNGFLTVDDLVKRGAALPAAVAGSQQDLQDQIQIRPLQRQAGVQQISSDIALQPRKSELDRGMTEARISALPTPEEAEASAGTRAKAAQIQNALNNPRTRLQTIATMSEEDVLDTWTAAHGQPPPETVEVPGGGVEPMSIDQWVIQQHGESALAGDAQAVLTRPDVVQGYAAYVQEAKNRPLTYFKGDPEYLAALKDDLKKAKFDAAIQEVQFKAAPGILQDQAKAQLPDPGRAGKTESDLVAQSTSRLKNFRDQAEAFEKLKGLKNKPNPTNADDVSLIYSYIKLLDPNSAVREGEIHLTQRASPLTDRLKQEYRRLWSREEGVLSPQTRLNYISTVETLFEGVKEANRPEVERISSATTAGGGNVNNVLNSMERSLLTGGATPASSPGAGSINPADVKPGGTWRLNDGTVVKIKSVNPDGTLVVE